MCLVHNGRLRNRPLRVSCRSIYFAHSRSSSQPCNTKFLPVDIQLFWVVLPYNVRRRCFCTDFHHAKPQILYNIVILPGWVPCNINSIADNISRISDFDDWSVDQISFDLIEGLWGPHTFDRFACSSNCKVHKFNSRFWCRGTSGVDAFCQDWSSDNNYLCPPVSLIVYTLKKLRNVKGAVPLSLLNGRRPIFGHSSVQTACTSIIRFTTGVYYAFHCLPPPPPLPRIKSSILR